MRRLLVALLLLTATACGSGGTTVTIEAPESGAEVQVPFTVEVSTSASLGPPDSGRPSLRVAIDGMEVATVNDTTFEVTRDLVPGPHTIHVSLLLPPGEEGEGLEEVPGGADEVTVSVTSAGR
jgi:hypothetical protein